MRRWRSRDSLSTTSSPLGKIMNKNLLSFFTSNYGRGRVVLVGSSDWIGKAIRVSQSKLTPDGNPSLWSHTFIIGEMRPDRRDSGHQHRSPYLFESDLHVDPPHAQLRNGAQENWIGKWCQDDIEHAAILDFALSFLFPCFFTEKNRPFLAERLRSKKSCLSLVLAR